ACLLESETGIARVQLAAVAIAEIAEEVHLPFAVGEKSGVHLGGIKAGHRAAIQSQGARREDEIGTLQRAVAETGFFDEWWLAGEVRAHIRLRKQPGEMFVELRVVGDDRGYGRGAGL